MIELSESAQAHFRALIEAQDLPGLGVRIRAVAVGTPRGDCELEFCEPADLAGDELEIACTGFSLYVSADSVEALEGAQIDFTRNATGGQLSIKAPRLRGTPPDQDASIADRVRYLIETEINPQLASHGGRVSLQEVTADGVVVLQFGGGCHGCGQVSATLQHGVLKTLRERIPEVTAVRDVTDHASGKNPYFRKG